MSDNVHGYELKRSILFENDRGFALGENPQAVQPFATWQFTEENGKRDYYWGHYTTNSAAATRDYENRVSEYQHEYGVSENPLTGIIPPKDLWILAHSPKRRMAPYIL